MRFGISTHLFHGDRLGDTHLAAVATHGFSAVELFATRTHVDYHDPSAIAAVTASIAAAGLTLHSVHAPITEGYVDGVWGPTISIAVADQARRQAAVREAEAALRIADHAPFEFLVVHLGLPVDLDPKPDDNRIDAARRSIDELHALAGAAGVRLALEVLPNPLSSVAALRRLIDDDLELDDAGVCLDFGHAHVMGDVVDAIEEASGHLVTTHVHDNRGRQDDHLVPFAGTIDWPAALFAAQKVGFDGVWMFEVAGAGEPDDVLRRSQAACRRFEEIVDISF